MTSATPLLIEIFLAEGRLQQQRCCYKPVYKSVKTFLIKFYKLFISEMALALQKATKQI